MTAPVLKMPAQPSRYALTQLAVLRLQGPDRVKYLHSQVTCDVEALAPGQQSLGAHCDAKGKMWADFRLLVLEESLLLLTKHSLLARQLPELKKYAVFSKLELDDASSALPVVGLAGQGTDALMQQHLGLAGDGGLIPGGLACRIEPDRWLLVAPSLAPALAALPAQPEADWWGLEILAGLPHLADVHQGEWIPQMLNLQALGGISFTKGCYLGQETVARAKYRGANNRALFILEGHASQAVAPGAVLEVQLGEQWRRGGVVVDVWQRDGQLLLSAVLPLDTETNARFRLKEEPLARLQLRPLPYSLAE